jgi:cytosine/adenosine deaminase-related metal-dependent hydrolase
MTVLSPAMIAVHGAQLSRPALDRLAARGASLVTCPRSNRYVGVGDPPVRDFYDSGVAVAIGTDSLASAPDLSIWPELARLHELAPEVPPSRLLDSATRIGAYALGFGDEFGTIEPGKRASLISVALPPDVEDVETYLVQEIEPSQVSWVG